MTGDGGLTDEQRFGAALASLGASPATVRRFLDGHDPRGAWEALHAGRHRAEPSGRHRGALPPERVDAVTAACRRAGVAVWILGRPGYPPALADDRQAPAVLFSRGDPAVLEGRPRVAVVGTRSATAYGLGVAAELGGELARAGVVVVSGLAPGVCAAAHRGALGAAGDVEAAPTVGILGSPLGAAAGRAQADLEAAVAQGGAVLGEVAPGAPVAPWWFALRHRIVAALAHVVVVVECHGRGASLHTVTAALRRGTTVGAVPGSVRSSASRGTNRLLADGALVVRDVDDVLCAVELAVAGRPDTAPPRPAPPRPARPRSVPAAPVANPTPSPTAALGVVARRVLVVLDHEPATVDTVVARGALSVGEAALGLEQLAQRGLAVVERGWWSRPR